MMSPETKWQIIVAERGWVFVGVPIRDGDRLRISPCWNVRNWGTKTGLGELALEGPQPDTILDYYGTVRMHILALPGGAIECNDEVWSAWSEKALKAIQKRSRK